MGINIRFYDPANPLTGGAKGSLLGSIVVTSEQTVSAADFASVTSEQAPGSTNYYFRKIFMTNHEAVDLLSPEVYFDGLEYPDQISFAREASSDDTTTNPYVMPSGYSSSDFMSPTSLEDRVALFADSSDLAASADAAIWIRIKAKAGLTADANAIGTLRVRGTLSS